MEGFPVFYQNRAVGTVALEQWQNGVCFDAICSVEEAPILRLYGERDGNFLPIGVLAPQGDVLQIRRTLSQQTLREHGFADMLPRQFLLSEQPPQSERTGDRLIDAALQNGAVTLQHTADGFEISCPFDPSVPSPLAFALTACTVIERRAVLRISR